MGRPTLYQLHDDETTLLERKCRATGTRVQLVYNEGADASQPWETICVDHGGVCSHETRALAMAWLSHPDEWCEDCTHGEGTLDGTRQLEDATTTPTCKCGEPEDGGEFGWFTTDDETYCNSCGAVVKVTS